MGKNRSYKRKGMTRKPKDTFLIVCQGEETEKNYFKSIKKEYRISNLQIMVESTDPENMVDYTLKQKCRTNSRINEAWCVFDKDETTDENFNKSIVEAKNHKIGVAYSNECFELWLCLHFEYNEAKLNRDGYLNKIKRYFQNHFNKEYKKNDPEIYKKLKDKMDTAKKFAKKLLRKHSLKNPAKANPSTTVHRLIEKLEEKNSF